MNFLSGIISTILGLIIGIVIGFFLLIALNGFSGKAGDYAVYTYIVLAIIVALAVGAISFAATNYLGKTSINKALAVILPIIVSLVLSVIGDIVGMFISAVVAENLWKK
ncbi:MAG TPA: hypothetical protein PKY82_12845 [Pyrinomonadaceae bacterium]|nr:hypothetical protein [Pyrinomonadaceae bacterium]